MTGDEAKKYGIVDAVVEKRAPESEAKPKLAAGGQK